MCGAGRVRVIAVPSFQSVKSLPTDVLVCEPSLIYFVNRKSEVRYGATHHFDGNTKMS